MAIKLTVWLIVWILAFMGVYDRQYYCDDDDVCASNMNAAQVSLFLLSFYWTNQVLANILHVTVAGVFSTWWFSPEEASSCCSKSITDSFFRSVTYSFGSICLGSLVVAIIQVMRYLLNSLRRTNRRGAAGSLLLCILQCVMGCLQSIIEYYNKWAFVYVGIYGYDFSTAAKKVITLFRLQGWTNIINDQLVHRTFLILNIIIAALTGAAGMAIAAISSSFISNETFHENKHAALGIVYVSSFLIGFAMANILTSVIASAVDTVIVCFAEAPEDFRGNHPELHEKMVNAWREIYSDEYEYAAVPNEPSSGNERNI